MHTIIVTEMCSKLVAAPAQLGNLGATAGGAVTPSLGTDFSFSPPPSCRASPTSQPLIMTPSSTSFVTPDDHVPSVVDSPTSLKSLSDAMHPPSAAQFQGNSKITVSEIGRKTASEISETILEEQRCLGLGKAENNFDQLFGQILTSLDDTSLATPPEMFADIVEDNRASLPHHGTLPKFPLATTSKLPQISEQSNFVIAPTAHYSCIKMETLLINDACPSLKTNKIDFSPSIGKTILRNNNKFQCIRERPPNSCSQHDVNKVALNTANATKYSSVSSSPEVNAIPTTLASVPINNTHIPIFPITSSFPFSMNSNCSFSSSLLPSCTLASYVFQSLMTLKGKTKKKCKSPQITESNVSKIPSVHSFDGPAGSAPHHLSHNT